MYLNHRILATVQRFARDDSAAATVEFVIIAPMLFWFVFSMFEVGWLMTQQTMLARGVNMAVRDLRLGNTGVGTTEEMQNEIKGRVCFHARILRDCYEQIFLEMVILDGLEVTNLSPKPTCLDLDPTEPVVPAINFHPGARDPNPSTMLLRVCVLVDLLLPGFGIAKNLTRDNTGRYQMVAFTAFANEPS